MAFKVLYIYSSYKTLCSNLYAYKCEGESEPRLLSVFLVKLKHIFSLSNHCCSLIYITYKCEGESEQFLPGKLTGVTTGQHGKVTRPRHTPTIQLAGNL